MGGLAETSDIEDSLLLAKASAGRRSELQVLVFDSKYIQFKPKGAGVALYFSPEFMCKNQKPNQVNYPYYIPAVPTGKSEFGTPNCPCSESSQILSQILQSILS